MLYILAKRMTFDASKSEGTSMYKHIHSLSLWTSPKKASPSWVSQSSVMGARGGPAVLVRPGGGGVLGLHGDLHHAQPGVGNTSVHNVSL